MDAIQWDGKNKEECVNFLGIDFEEFADDETVIVYNSLKDTWAAQIGDFLVKDWQGDIYNCDADTFYNNYQKDSVLDDEHFMNTILSVPKSAVEIHIECKYYDREIKTMKADLLADDIQENRRMYLELDPHDDHFVYWVINDEGEC